MKTKNDRCLDDQDFYNFIAGKGAPDPQIQAHLSSCSDCREGLAEIMQMLDEDPAEPAKEMPPQEINDSIAAIQASVRPAPINKRLYRWGSIAAAAVLAIGLTSVGFMLYVRYKSQSYCNQAQALLQTVYQARSPNDLRLDLPFQSDVTMRAASDKNEAIDGAERLYNQALGLLDGMTQARLGLAYLDLQKNRFGKAESQFQKVLESKPENMQALVGRGVSRFEEGLAAIDPAKRNHFLDGALKDFEQVLRLNPGSKEARYNKIQVLYNTGLHKEALQEIDAYLQQDSNSTWAAKLKELKIRINVNDINRLVKEAERASLTRDESYLETLVRVAPDKIPTSVITMHRDALALEGRPAIAGAPDSESIIWAAQYMAYAYQQATGDNSCTHLIKFYAGLSPPQRKLKQTLDARLEQLIKLYDKTQFQQAIKESEPVIQGFIALGDYWQLVRAHQLRGSCWQTGQNNYAMASREFVEMRKYAELSGHSELIARSLQSLASAYTGTGEIDKHFACISKLEAMSQSSHMNYLNTYIFYALGRTYSRSNQNDISLRYFLSCLSLSYRLMDTNSLIGSLENIGSLMEKEGKNSDAKQYYAECATWLRTILKEGLRRANSEIEWHLLMIQIKIGVLANQTKDYVKAESIFQEMLNSYDGRFEEFEAINRLGLAKSYFGQNKFEQAKEELDKSLNLAEKNHYLNTVWDAKYVKALLSEQRGNNEKAIEFLAQSTRTIEKMRSAVSDISLRQSFFSQRFDPYRKTASLLFHSNKLHAALAYADRAKSITLREILKLRENQTLNALDFPRQLTSKTCLLEYFFGTNELLIFLISKDGMDSIAIPVSEADLKELISQYLDSITANNSAAFLRLSQKLYGILIEPMRSKQNMEQAENLIILADGPLHLLPFSSLIDKSGRSLLEHYAISYALSQSLLQYLLDKNKDGTTSRESSLLFLDGGSDLRGSDREYANILNIFKKNKLLSDPNSIKSGVSFDPYQIIHFSGHAALQMGKPQLVFHTSTGDKFLDSESIKNWNLKNSKLVVLAGCNTGMGPVSAGESPWGLTPSFLRAGACAILVSLFPVDDLTTAAITSRFYELLASGSSKTHALRVAQLSLLRSKSKNRPDMWAPFILIGDPR